MEPRSDESSGSPKEIFEDETVHNQVAVEEGKKAPIKKEVLKQKPKKDDRKIKLVVEENYSREGEQSVDSASQNVSTIDDKLKSNQGAEYFLFTILPLWNFCSFSYILWDIWFKRTTTHHVCVM